MRPTRRCWTILGAGLTLAAGAVIFQRPLLVFGSAAIGAWLIAQFTRFLFALQRADETLAIDRELDRDRIMTETPVSVTLTGRVHEATDLSVTIDDEAPVGARTASADEDRRLHLDGKTPSDRCMYSVTAPLAGTLSFMPPTVTITDGAGLFQERVARGPESTLAVSPRTPRNIHVGESGRQVAMAYGEHEVDQRGAGLDPAELRKYVAGDTASRIDWKATARLNEPYVREFEVETDRKTSLVVDHRAGMAIGQPGQTQLDYLREVALVIVEGAQNVSDPLGCYTVGDGGPTERLAPATSDRQYAQITDHLQRLSPTDTKDRRTPTQGRSPATSRRAAAQLQSADSPFARTLTPYFQSTDQYLERIADDPLFETVRGMVTRLQGTLFTIICTDDGNRAELREAVKLARRGENGVLVLLTPRCLFEPGGLADLEDAYAEYLEFEEFRRDLSGLERVTALEVAPGDRLAAVLQSNRRTSQQRNIS